MAERTLPTPGTTVENAAFFAAAAEDRFMIGHCRDCDEPHFYPRAICPHCFSDATELKPSAGEGTIYSFSVMRRVPEPYAIAYVTLKEGVTLLTNLVDCDFDALAIGQTVKVAFRPTEDGTKVPVFVPAA